MSEIMQGALLERPLVLNHREMEPANLPAHVYQLDLTSRTLTLLTDVGDLLRDWLTVCVQWNH